MLRSWTLRVVPKTVSVSIADKAVQQRCITYKRIPSTPTALRKSTSASAVFKAAKDSSDHESARPASSSDSQNSSGQSEKDDALHLLAKVEPTLSLNQPKIPVRKHMVNDQKDGALVKIRMVEGKELVCERTKIGAPEVRENEGQDEKSVPKAVQAAPRSLSALYEFDSARQFFRATGVRRPVQIKRSSVSVDKGPQDPEETSWAEREVTDSTDLSGRPQRRLVMAAVGSKVGTRPPKRRRVLQGMSGQFWRFVSKRSVLTRPVNIMKRQRLSRIWERRSRAKKMTLTSDRVQSLLRGHVARRRLRKVYFLRITPSKQQPEWSSMDGTQSTESLTLDTTGSEPAEDSRQKATEAPQEDSDLIDAIDELTKPPRTVRRAPGRRKR